MTWRINAKSVPLILGGGNENRIKIIYAALTDMFCHLPNDLQETNYYEIEFYAAVYTKEMEIELKKK